MPFTTSARHIAVDNFHTNLGGLSYYVLGNRVQFRAPNGDTFYRSYQELQNPATGSAFGSVAELVAYLDANAFS